MEPCLWAGGIPEPVPRAVGQMVVGRSRGMAGAACWVPVSCLTLPTSEQTAVQTEGYTLLTVLVHEANHVRWGSGNTTATKSGQCGGALAGCSHLPRPKAHVHFSEQASQSCWWIQAFVGTARQDRYSVLCFLPGYLHFRDVAQELQGFCVFFPSVKWASICPILPPCCPPLVYPH